MVSKSQSVGWPSKSRSWKAGQIGHRRHFHRYYVGPGPVDRASVLLLHEFPGLSWTISDFADELSDHFRVIVPSIVGRDGTDPSVAHLLYAGASLCIRREVHFLAMGRESPAIEWLRKLVDTVVSPQGKPFGVIGMCMSGGFALTLAVDPRVQAAIVAQPALPVASYCRKGRLPGWRRRERDLGIAKGDEERLRARARTVGGEQVFVMGRRYDLDWQSPQARFDVLSDLLGIAADLQTLPNISGKHLHSTLTGTSAHLPARKDVIDLLRKALCVDPRSG